MRVTLSRVTLVRWQQPRRDQADMMKEEKRKLILEPWI